MTLSSLTGKKLLAALLTICLFQTVTQAAQFTNSFDNVRSGSSLLLTWEGVKREHYPLYITAQVIQERESEDGRIRADAWRMNITAGMTESSYEWTSVPYPLRWIPSGLYQLELWSMRWTEEDQLPPLLAQSSVFRISEPETGNGQSTGQSSSGQDNLDDQNGDSPTKNKKTLAVGLAVAIGVPSVIAIVVLARILRKRQQRLANERRNGKRAEFVIT